MAEDVKNINEQGATEPTPPVVEVKKPDDKAVNEEIAKLKAALSKANSDAADWKRQYKATLDEHKQKELEAAEARKAELAELEQLRTEKRISSYKAKLMEAGIDAETAATMANSLPEGVADGYFEATKAFLTNQRKAFDAEALGKQPGLSVGMPPSPKNTEDDKYDKWFGLR